MMTKVLFFTMDIERRVYFLAIEVDGEGANGKGEFEGKGGNGTEGALVG